MTDQLHKTTQDMIGDYYRKDQRYRRTLTILVILVLALATFGVFKVYQIYDKQTQQDELLVEQAELLIKSTDEIKQQINCVGKFFQQSNRAEVVIPDLDECAIIRQ